MIDNQYWFAEKSSPATSDLAVDFDGKTLVFPAKIMSKYSNVVMTVLNGKEKTVFDDWTVSKTEHKEKGMIDTFSVSLTSKKIQSFSFKKNMVINVSVAAGTNSSEISYTFGFKVDEGHTLWVFPYPVYRRTK